MSNKEQEQKQQDPIEFEKSFAELEALVSRMEAGDQSLQKSVDDFQSGIELIKQLQEELQKAEQKVDILIKDASGHTTRQPFDVKAQSFDTDT